MFPTCAFLSRLKFSKGPRDRLIAIPVWHTSNAIALKRFLRVAFIAMGVGSTDSCLTLKRTNSSNIPHADLLVVGVHAAPLRTPLKKNLWMVMRTCHLGFVGHIADMTLFLRPPCKRARLAMAGLNG